MRSRPETPDHQKPEHRAIMTAPNAAFTPRIFSGIQPSGGLTLGNYLGALKRFVEKQDEGIETVYCLVDLHAITVWQDPEKLRQQTREAAAGFIAAGIDPARSILFNQSQVSAHAELGWILNCVARLGWMNRMTQFKDKVGKNAENASLGLYAYPALMAADILLYHATMVPVGEDQRQHVELTRDIAAKFNHDYGVDFFPLTEPVIEGAATRVMSLRDGTKKMSKSDPSDQSRINLTDDAETIAAKIRKARTDADPLPESAAGLKDRPEARNLVNIYAALSGETPDQVTGRFSGQGFGAFKPALADLAVARLSPITEKMKRLMDAPDEIDRILGQGAARADSIARPILNRVLDITGMIRSR
jgi:tryptophanyl-tRNA synthetase